VRHPDKESPVTSHSKSPDVIAHGGTTDPPLKLCEAGGQSGWLQRFIAPGQRPPEYKVLQARSYDGEYPTRIVGRHRVIDQHNIPRLLEVFELTPRDQHAEAVAA
jgi:hypothetical protein